VRVYCILLNVVLLFIFLPWVGWIISIVLFRRARVLLLELSCDTGTVLSK